MDSFLENHQESDDKKDLISGLPDDMLSHILSFLPLKFAARTSILSHRWQYLWTSILDLEFTCRLDQTANESKKFVSTVDQVLSLRGTTQIRKLKLSFYSAGVTGLFCITSWIKPAVKHNVRELDLHIMEDDEVIELPPTLFTCKTLVILKLQSGCTFSVPSLIQVPCLKVLHVIGYLSKTAAERLFCSCSVLEDLLIEGYAEDDVTVSLNIIAQALKKLSIFFGASQEDQIVIDAPKCEYLYIDFTAKLEVKSLSSVVKAHINFGSCSQHHGGHYKSHNWDYTEYLLHLLKKISNLKFLLMSSETVAVIIGALDQNLSPFPNLVYLKLTIRNCCDWQFLPNLLNNSPKLKVLVLKKNTLGCNYVRDYEWSSPQSVPKCLLSNLKSIYIERFTGRKNELKMMEFFLKNGEVLKKLTVKPLGLALKDEETLLEKVLMLPRVSGTCDVKFVKD